MRISALPTWTTSFGPPTLFALSLIAVPVHSEAQELETCAAPYGTLAVYEPQDELLSRLQSFGLESPTSLIRMMVQESSCFIVVERGVAMQRMAQERELASGGQFAADANMGGGQMQAADFYLTPDILFSEDNAGGIGGAVGGLLGRRTAGIVGGALKFKEAETSILIANTRSGVQVAAAQGKAKTTEFSLGALGFFGGALGGLGGYSNTNEGKVIAKSFLDNLNNVVASVRQNPNLRPLTAEEVHARVTGVPVAGDVFAEGDLLYPKIDNVPLLAAPEADAEVLTTVVQADALVYLGAEENGYLEVQGSSGMGWIRKVLVSAP